MSLKKIILFCCLILSALGYAQKEAQRYKSLELLSKVIYVIEKQYYREVDHQKLIEGAVTGMVAQLDPHSSFLNKALMKQVREDTEGTFGGLGVEVYKKDSAAMIVNVIEESPAFEAGVQPGDQIVEINKENLSQASFNEVIKKLQGRVGQKVLLGVKREGESKVLRFSIKRKIIKVKAVQGTLLEKHIAYIRLIQFQDKLGVELQRKLKSLKKKSKNQIEGIILDLRGNPGGLLDEAVNVSSVFLKSGVVVSTESRDPNKKDIRYVKKSGYKDLETPIVVLINGSSASASEIVAGALQDHKRAIVAGSRSFGKGSVQSVAQINEEQGLKLTIAQYLTPSKRKIQAIGVIPDIKLADLDLSLILEKYPEREFIRERDLSNHLLATDEKKSSSKPKSQSFFGRRNKKKKLSFMEKKLEKDSQVQDVVKILKAQKIFSNMNSNF